MAVAVRTFNSLRNLPSGSPNSEARTTLSLLLSLVATLASPAVLIAFLLGVAKGVCPNDRPWWACPSAFVHGMSGDAAANAKNITVSGVMNFIAHDQHPLAPVDQYSSQTRWPWMKLLLILVALSHQWLLAAILWFIGVFFVELGSQMAMLARPLQPDLLEKLERNTSFTTQEIRDQYKDFCLFAPNGSFHTENLMLLFRKVYPSGDPTRFAPILFQKLDTDSAGSVDFEKLIVFSSAWYRGDVRGWVTVLFRILDVDNDGVVSRDDCATAINSWHTATSEVRVPTGANLELSSGVGSIFSALDINKVGFLNLQDVLDICSRNRQSVEKLRDTLRATTADLRSGWALQK